MPVFLPCIDSQLPYKNIPPIFMHKGVRHLTLPPHGCRGPGVVGPAGCVEGESGDWGTDPTGRGGRGAQGRPAHPRLREQPRGGGQGGGALHNLTKVAPSGAWP